VKRSLTRTLKSASTTLRDDLLGIGEITAHRAELAAIHRCLEILDLGAERREVERRRRLKKEVLSPTSK
jgi:uncharacterized protein (UPF0218 family)